MKRHRFDCYKDPLDETIEFSFSLYDATIDLAHKRLKRDLALRLVHDGKEVLIEVKTVHLPVLSQMFCWAHLVFVAANHLSMRVLVCFKVNIKQINRY